MSHNAEQVIRTFYRTVLESGDVSGAAGLVTDDFVDHELPMPVEPGVASVQALVGFLHSTFADLRYTVEDIFETGDRIAFRVFVDATQRGPLFGHPTLGRSMRVQQIHICRMADGRIAEHWACRDDLGAMRQLGHLPQPA